MSYPFAAFLTGFLAERRFNRRYLTSVIAMAAGLTVIFAGGVALAGLVRPSRAHAGLDAALRTGLYPFLPADMVKVCVAAAVMPGGVGAAGPTPLIFFVGTAASQQKPTGGPEFRRKSIWTEPAARLRLKINLLTS